MEVYKGYKKDIRKAVLRPALTQKRYPLKMRPLVEVPLCFIYQIFNSAATSFLS